MTAHEHPSVSRPRRKALPLALPLAVALAALVAAGCGGGDSGGDGTATNGGTAGGSLVGAGSSFVFPLVSQWIPQMADRESIDITYSPDGSGAGISAISNRVVDFGASDAPLTSDQFAACKGCVQIPWALSATSIAYNLPGVEGLRLTGPLLAGIYLGTITRWNDSRIEAINPGADLPDLRVVPAFRSDNSGTSYNFTDFLSQVSPAWKDKVGAGASVQWPAGQGARGSSGVTGVVKQTEGALTYVDVAYAQQNELATAFVANAAGVFVGPTLEAIGAAAASIAGEAIPPSGEISIVAPPPTAKEAYPICTFTYVIVPIETARAPDLTSFVTYALGDGQSAGPDLLFRPLPTAVRAFGRDQLAKIHP